MRRREFLGLVGKTVAVAAIPTSLFGAVASKEQMKPISLAKGIEWMGHTGDWGRSYSIGGRITVGGRVYAQAVAFSAPLKDLSKHDIDVGKKLVMESLARIIEI